MSAEDILLSIGTFVVGAAVSLLIGWLHVVMERRFREQLEELK